MTNTQKKQRLDRWKTPSFILTLLTGPEGKRKDQISKWQAEADYEEKPEWGQLEIIKACQELIFNIQDGRPVFHAIGLLFDTEKICIRVEHVLDILIEEDETGDQIKNTLALAKAYDVPVFPNSADLASTLSNHHRAMLTEGFTAPDETGTRIRLMLAKSPGERINRPEYLSELDVTESYSPADLLLIRDAVESELNRLDTAQQFLDSIGVAVMQLSGLLDAESRNEHALQRCLTENPILFGPEYLRVIAKHKLGAEYEMDYALERFSGIYDLVEIESSNLPVFNKKGNPSYHLIHAEQQVIDWLNWIEKNSSYARQCLPGLMSPVGYVIIGRSNNLSENISEKIRRRNQLFRGQIEILTYDDLLSRARSLLERLEGTLGKVGSSGD